MESLQPTPPVDYWHTWEELFARVLRRSGEARVKSDLASADARVRAHEQAHLAAAGPYATSSAHYTHVRGPDGRMYAVGGHVSVDLQPVPGNPEATLRKARALRRAAFAPGQPSAADMRVAAEAYRLEQQAEQEIKERREGSSPEGTEAENPFDPPLYV